jgi:hypothetical protein
MPQIVLTDRSDLSAGGDGRLIFFPLATILVVGTIVAMVAGFIESEQAKGCELTGKT